MEIQPLKGELFRFKAAVNQKEILIRALNEAAEKENARQNPDAEALLNWKSALEKWQGAKGVEADLTYDEADYLHQAVYRFKDTDLAPEDRKKAAALFEELDAYFPDEEED